jgi:hypothetical protein
VIKWTYKCDRVLCWPIYKVENFLNFIKHLSWSYAHYRNGSFPYQFPNSLRLRWVEMSHWELWKESWRSRNYDE